MKEYDQSHPLSIKKEEEKEEEKKKEEEEEKKEEKQKKAINLTKEEEECINEYEKFLKKILKAFNILYLCKSKQEFLNLMKEKGISQQIETKSSVNKNMRGKRKITKKGNKQDIKSDANENKNNDEEDDISNFDPDKKILTKFIKEQKKEIDEFINVKKPPTNTTKPAGSK